MKRFNHLWRAFKRRILGHPVFDGKVRVYLTLRCNLQCEYCVNNHVDGGVHLREYTLLTPKEWLHLLHTLDRDIIITGGEPFLYTGLKEIIQGLKAHYKITIYSNLMVPLPSDISWLKRKGLTIYGSYHPGQRLESSFIKNVQALQHEGVHFTLHAINTQGRDQLAKILGEQLAGQDLKVTIDEDQRELFPCSSKQYRKRVLCRKSIILIAPDGYRYPCVSRLVRRTEPLENLLKEPFTTEWQSVECPDYGFCAPCDGLGEVSFVPMIKDEK